MELKSMPIVAAPKLQPITDLATLRLMSGWTLSDAARAEIAAIEENVRAAWAMAHRLRVD